MQKEHNPIFWTIGKDGEKIQRDLLKESEEFSLHAYHNGEGRLDDINYMYYEMFQMFGEHDSQGSDYERFGCVIDPGDVVVDIGGNIGMFSRRALERGASRVITFEPMSKAFSCLTDNVGYDVEAYNIAISDKTSATKMGVAGVINNLGGSTLKIEKESREIIYTEPCITMSLEDLWNLGVIPETIDFLKVDCEGGEKEIIESLTDEHLSRIKKISMEYHAGWLDHELREEFTDRLYNLGFQRFTLFHGDGSLTQLHFWK